MNSVYDRIEYCQKCEMETKHTLESCAFGEHEMKCDKCGNIFSESCPSERD